MTRVRRELWAGGGRPSEAAAARPPHGRRLRPPPAGGGGRLHRSSAAAARPPPPRPPACLPRAAAVWGSGGGRLLLGRRPPRSLHRTGGRRRPPNSETGHVDSPGRCPRAQIGRPQTWCAHRYCYNLRTGPARKRGPSQRSMRPRSRFCPTLVPTLPICLRHVSFWGELCNPTGPHPPSLPLAAAGG